MRKSSHIAPVFSPSTNQLDLNYQSTLLLALSKSQFYSGDAMIKGLDSVLHSLPPRPSVSPRLSMQLIFALGVELSNQFTKIT